MSRATVPWVEHNDGYARVSAIRDYIKSDASSDVRNPFANEPIRIIWNGATFQDHVDAKPQSTSFKPGTCKVSLSNYQEAYVSGFITYGWQGLISDDAGAPIPSCSTQKQVIAAATNYGIPCTPLGNRLDVHAVGKDSVEFKMGDQTWRSGDKNCAVQDWTQDGTSITPVSLRRLLSAMGAWQQMTNRCVRCGSLTVHSSARLLIVSQSVEVDDATCAPQAKACRLLALHPWARVVHGLLLITHFGLLSELG
jgi:hypothetical protein